MENLTDQQRADIDAHILARGYLASVIRIRDVCHVGIYEAKTFWYERYKQLRAERPAEFLLSDEEYCAGILE